MKLPIIDGIVRKIRGQEDIRDDIGVPQETPPPDFSPITQFTSSEPFFKAQELNMQVDSLDDFLNALWKSSLSTRLKKSLTLYVQTMLDRNIMLTNMNENEVKIASIWSKINKKATMLSNAFKSDRKNPEWITFERMIEPQVMARLNRATGGDGRERMIISFLQLKYHQTTSREPMAKKI